MLASWNGRRFEFRFAVLINALVANRTERKEGSHVLLFEKSPIGVGHEDFCARLPRRPAVPGLRNAAAGKGTTGDDSADSSAGKLPGKSRHVHQSEGIHPFLRRSESWVPQ